MKYFSGVANYQFPWDQVVSAYWQRYPNPQSTHVLSEDILQRNIKDNKLHSLRVLTKTNKLPRWGERFLSKTSCTAPVVEESVCDPVNKTFTTYTRNVGLNTIMTVEEKCTYKPHPDDPSKTLCERQAWISSSLFGFAYAIQKFGHERFKSNANKAVRGFEHVLNRLYMPDNIPLMDTTSKINLNKEMIKTTAIKAKDTVKEKAKEKGAAVVATYTGGAAAS